MFDVPGLTKIDPPLDGFKVEFPVIRVYDVGKSRECRLVSEKAEDIEKFG